LTAVGGIEAVIETKNTVALTEQLRKLESDCIDIDKKLGSVVLISEVRKWISEIFTKVKTDLRGLPFAAADELAAMSDPEKIAEFLKKKIDDALRHLAKGFNEQSIKKSI
jgi:hypothetical protein